MKAFIVIENGGEYEDSYSSILAVFLNKDLAEAYKANKEAEYERQEKEVESETVVPIKNRGSAIQRIGKN